MFLKINHNILAAEDVKRTLDDNLYLFLYLSTYSSSNYSQDSISLDDSDFSVQIDPNSAFGSIFCIWRHHFIYSLNTN